MRFHWGPARLMLWVPAKAASSTAPTGCSGPAITASRRPRSEGHLVGLDAAALADAPPPPRESQVRQTERALSGPLGLLVALVLDEPAGPLREHSQPVGLRIGRAEAALPSLR